MKIACEACGAKYTIADGKVRGRKVKIRCKSCGKPIVVDAQLGSVQGGTVTEADVSLEPAEPALIWSVNLSDTDSRTMNVDEIVQAYAQGVVTADAFVWKDGMPDWVPLLDSEIAPLLSVGESASEAEAVPEAPAAPAGPPPQTAAADSGGGPRGTIPLFAAPNQATAAARPAAIRPSAQPDNTQDLFGGAEDAGGDEDVATSAPAIPQAGTSAYDDGKLTGARNENSVLFSLDALKAGFSPNAPAARPPAPAPRAPTGSRPRQVSNPDDPFGMGQSDLMGVGGGALFGTDNQALLRAPATPPPPPPTATTPFAGGAPVPAARPANGKLVMIVGALGGLLIVGLLLALLLGKKHEEVPTAEGSAGSSSSGATLSASPEPKKEEEPAPKPEQPSAETSASSAAPTPPASASASASATPAVTKPSEKPLAVGSGSKPSEPVKKKEEPAPVGAADAQPFSKSAAISGLTAASMSASACKKPGGPTGPGKATVTFAPSGRVTTATVSGAYAGTAVGGCVASGFRKAHVPPFSGSAVTVSKSFSIN